MLRKYTTCYFLFNEKFLSIILYITVMFLSLNIRTVFQWKIIWIEIEFFHIFLTLLWCNLVREAAGGLSCKVFFTFSEKRDGWIGTRETDDLQILSRLYYIYFNKRDSFFVLIYKVVRVKDLNQDEFWVNRTWNLYLRARQNMWQI